MEDINIEDFLKIDLRVARIVDAESLEEADKLFKYISWNTGFCVER